MRKLVTVPAVIIILTLLSIVSNQPVQVYATHDPVDFTMSASFFGWNSTSPPVNPTLVEFRGVPFTATIKWVDDTHNFAIYPKGATPINPFQPCVAPCLARSPDVEYFTLTSELTFTPTIPPDDNTGTGTYEYYCEYHPSSMHGQITVYKSPDIDGDGSVTILDISEMAFRFDTAAGDTLYLATSDLDNDGDIDISDIAFAAILFDKILTD